MRRADNTPRDWINYLVACRSRIADELREHLPGLYAYLGGEMGWSPSELDKHSLGELTEWGNARSAANEREPSG